MRGFNQWGRSFSLVVLGACLVIASHAEEVDDRTSGNASGKTLFNHQWQSIQPVKKRRVRKRARPMVERQMPIQEFDETAPIDRHDGLGPQFSARSCASCHPNGGAGGVRSNVILITVEPRSKQVADPADLSGKDVVDLFPGLVDTKGFLKFQAVVHNYSTQAEDLARRDKLRSLIPGGHPDGWFNPELRTVDSVAKQPVLAGRHQELDFYLSQRNTPALHGIGLIEKINAGRLTRIASEQARKTDGEISGRMVGRYGWRGQITNLDEFVRQACMNELGLSNAPFGVGGMGFDISAKETAEPDMSEREIANLVGYVASLSAPIERNSSRTHQGEKLFAQAKCAICHRPEIRPVSGLFSDLLLHDMGPGLQSPMAAPTIFGQFDSQKIVMDFMRPQEAGLTRPKFSTKGTASSVLPSYFGEFLGDEMPTPRWTRKPADTVSFPPELEVAELKEDLSGFLCWESRQREWRTPPLWGVADTAPYLHDGRAATLKDAIMLHGGEAKSSRDKFRSMSNDDQELVSDFLRSLRAPE